MAPTRELAQQVASEIESIAEAARVSVHGKSEEEAEMKELRADSACDNVLLEYVLALELKAEPATAEPPGPPQLSAITEYEYSSEDWQSICLSLEACDISCDGAGALAAPSTDGWMQRWKRSPTDFSSHAAQTLHSTLDRLLQGPRVRSRAPRYRRLPPMLVPPNLEVAAFVFFFSEPSSTATDVTNGHQPNGK